MHTLETLQRINHEAFHRGIDTARGAGKHVVVKSLGLHVLSYELFDDSDAAMAHVQEQALAEHRLAGYRYIILFPK